MARSTEAVAGAGTTEGVEAGVDVAAAQADSPLCSAVIGPAQPGFWRGCEFPFGWCGEDGAEGKELERVVPVS